MPPFPSWMANSATVSQSGGSTGGGMDPATLQAIIGGGLGLFNTILGNSAQQRAQKQQAHSETQAKMMELQQLGMQAAASDYAMRRGAAHDARNMVLGNALLRSYGVTGLQDPAYDVNAFNAPPPDLLAGVKGGGRSLADLSAHGGVTGQPAGRSLADLYGG